jgi:hypothetical protein
MAWPRGEVVVCNNLIESENNLIDSEGKKLTQKSMTYKHTTNTDAPPFVDAAKNESRLASSVNQQ